jgi:hypothetical protein
MMGPLAGVAMAWEHQMARETVKNFTVAPV